MKYEALGKRVCSVNQVLVKCGLVTLTWGSVSEADRGVGVLTIRPPGAAYDDLRPEDMAVLSLKGRIVSRALNPSSDTKAYLEPYKAFSTVNGVVHTYSPYAVAWAQTGLDTPCYGTTYADYFYDVIPCAEGPMQAEIDGDYEENTGVVIIETFRGRSPDSGQIPGIIHQSYGPLTWGKDAADAIYHAVVMEEVAKMAVPTWKICHSTQLTSQWIRDKHYQRKHGSSAYYGQRG